MVTGGTTRGKFAGQADAAIIGETLGSARARWGESQIDRVRESEKVSESECE